MISRASLPAWFRRPVAVAGFSVVALAALLSGGLVVAHAVDGTPAADPSPTSSAATGNGTDNVAAGVNSTDGRTVYAIRLKLVQTTSDTVDATNAAVAVNSGCTDCSTYAIAFEGVVVVGSPSTFDPTNLALAYNQDCSGCTAFADAYQQVVQSSTRVRVTKEGRQEIARIRKDLNDLKHSTLSFEEIVAHVKADEQAFAQVLSTQLVPVGHVQDPAPADAADVSDTPDEAPATTQPSAAASDAASPVASASADPSTSPSSDPSSSPSPTATP